MIGNFTGTSMAPPDTARRNSVTNINTSSEPLGSDSDASTIAASPVRTGPPSRGDTTNNNESSDQKTLGVTPNGNSDAGDAASMARREEEVHQLARRYTSQSTYSTTGQNVFHAQPGSALDPNGEHFNARAWCKAMLHMQTEDERAHPPRTAGVAFKNLNVHGFGSATDYQKSVGNVWLEGPGLARKLAGQGKLKIDILRNLDGLVEAGEMLVVLGPPGSGCSTFLKTITGETHGFVVDGNSHINYQGALSNAF